MNQNMNKLFATLSFSSSIALTLILTVIDLSPFAGIVPLGSINTKTALAQTSTDLANFRTNALSKHNAYRAIHRSPAMTADSSLNSTAQSWAQNLASRGFLQHSSSSQRNNAGENLYVSYTTASSVNFASLANTAVQSWYNEVSKYNYANPGFSSATGHFTQVVWKNSTKLGCGTARGVATVKGTKYNAFYVVCHYAPAGNVQGQFPANVLKP